MGPKKLTLEKVCFTVCYFSLFVVVVVVVVSKKGELYEYESTYEFGTSSNSAKAS